MAVMTDGAYAGVYVPDSIWHGILDTVLRRDAMPPTSRITVTDLSLFRMQVRDTLRLCVESCQRYCTSKSALMAKRKISSGRKRAAADTPVAYRYDLGAFKGTYISIREIFDNGLARCDLYRDSAYKDLIMENIFVPLADIENLHR